MDAEAAPRQCIEGPHCCLTCGFKLLSGDEMAAIWQQVQALGGYESANLLRHAVPGLPARLLKLDTLYDASLPPGTLLVAGALDGAGTASGAL